MTPMKKVTHVEKKSGDISIQRDTTMGDHTKHLPSSFSRYTVFFFQILWTRPGVHRVTRANENGTSAVDTVWWTWWTWGWGFLHPFFVSGFSELRESMMNLAWQWERISLFERSVTAMREELVEFSRLDFQSWSLRNMFLHDLQLEHWRLSQIVGPLKSIHPRWCGGAPQWYVCLDSPHEVPRYGFVWKWSTPELQSSSSCSEMSWPFLGPCFQTQPCALHTRWAPTLQAQILHQVIPLVLAVWKCMTMYIKYSRPGKMVYVYMLYIHLIYLYVYISTYIVYIYI